MRKLLALVAAIALMGGAASAQDYWAGISVGTGGSLHFGVENLAENLDARANLGFNFLFSSGFTFGADALYHFDLDTGDLPLDVYAGGGLAFGVYDAAFGLGVNLFGGAEYRLIEADFPEGGIFFELGPLINFVPDFAPGAVGRLGFNYHF